MTNDKDEDEALAAQQLVSFRACEESLEGVEAQERAIPLRLFAALKDSSQARNDTVCLATSGSHGCGCLLSSRHQTIGTYRHEGSGARPYFNATFGFTGHTTRKPTLSSG